MLQASYGLRCCLTHATRWCNAKVRNGLRRNLAHVLARGLRRGREIGLGGLWASYDRLAIQYASIEACLTLRHFEMLLKTQRAMLACRLSRGPSLAHCCVARHLDDINLSWASTLLETSLEL